MSTPDIPDQDQMLVAVISALEPFRQTVLTLALILTAILLGMMLLALTSHPLVRGPEPRQLQLQPSGGELVSVETEGVEVRSARGAAAGHQP